MKLPVISGKKLIKALTKKGYYIRGQRGSHIHLRHPTKNPLTIPDHKELDRGTLNRILKDSNTKIEELMDLI